MTNATREKPVTAAMMIAALQKLSPETRIFVQAYESGLQDADAGCKIINVKLNVSDHKYSGPHEPFPHAYVGTVRGVVLLLLLGSALGAAFAYLFTNLTI